MSCEHKWQTRKKFGGSYEECGKCGADRYGESHARELEAQLAAAQAEAEESRRDTGAANIARRLAEDGLRALREAMERIVAFGVDGGAANAVYVARKALASADAPAPHRSVPLDPEELHDRAHPATGRILGRSPIRVVADAPAGSETCHVCGLRTTPFGPGEACTVEEHGLYLTGPTEPAASPGAVMLTAEELTLLYILLGDLQAPWAPCRIREVAREMAPRLRACAKAAAGKVES